MNPPEGLPQCCFGAAHDEPGYRCEEVATWRSVKSPGIVWCSDHAANFKPDEVEPIEAVRAEPELSATLSEPQIESSPTPTADRYRLRAMEDPQFIAVVDDISGLERERDDLKAENGRLRELLGEWIRQIDTAFREHVCDHACIECYPAASGKPVADGFRCVEHATREALAGKEGA